MAHQLGAEPGDQLVENEGLDDVVVAPGGKSLDAVGHLVLGAEEQERAGEAVLAERSAEVVAGSVGQHHVQHRVRAAGGHVLHRAPRGVDPLHRETRGAEAAVQQRPDVGVVLDDENVLTWHRRARS